MDDNMDDNTDGDGNRWQMEDNDGNMDCEMEENTDGDMDGNTDGNMARQMKIWKRILTEI